jgi:hypothetical protein
MKIIQSFWSLPITQGRATTFNNRLDGGWLSAELHLLSWAYSCLQLRQFYDQVELVTDETGKALLADAMQLPYTTVSTGLEKISHYDPDLWALGKLYACSRQQQPFLHVDGDVFVWERFPGRIEKAAFAVQNEEYNFSFYKTVMKQLLELDCYLPPAIWENFKAGNDISAYNAGIIGGNQAGFFQEFAEEAFVFIERNRYKLESLPAGQLNAFYEQHLFYCLTRQCGYTVECYARTRDKAEINRQFKGLPEFKAAPEPGSYIHLFGEDAKKNEAICAELERRMRLFYPDYYKRAIEVASCWQAFI